jgi:hypothetical protein
MMTRAHDWGDYKKKRKKGGDEEKNKRWQGVIEEKSLI